MDLLNKAFRLSTGLLNKLFEYLENKAWWLLFYSINLNLFISDDDLFR